MNVHVFIKAITGVIIVPYGIVVGLIWNWWAKSSMPVRVVFGVFVLPLGGVAYVLSNWWEKF